MQDLTVKANPKTAVYDLIRCLHVLFAKSILPVTSIVYALILIFSLTPQESVAAELLMLEQDDCVYCEKFNREIAEAYPNTSEGQQASLRRIDLHEKWPVDLSAIESDTLTPTFILVDNNKEFGRLQGYPGDEYFWFLLGEMLDDMNAALAKSSNDLSQ